MSEAETKPVEYERIWLAPWGADERTWCCDDVYEGEGVEYVLSSRLTSLMEENERLKAERDAAFAMSKCECGADEACRNLATAVARAQAAEQRVKEAVEIVKWFVENDETNEGDTPMPERGGRTWDEINAYWIEGLNRGRRFIKEAGE